jgi:hypothetical protein
MPPRMVSLLLLLAARLSIAQTPDVRLSDLSPEYQAWVNRSCQRSLGASIWRSCIEKEANALAQGVPNLSQLKPRDRAWILRSCPRTLAPSRAVYCLAREVRVLSEGIPSISDLSIDQRGRVQRACPRSLPPSLYRACLDRESNSAAMCPPSTVAATDSTVGDSSPGHQQPRGGSRTPRGSYEIEVSYKDDFFIINGSKFGAQTACSDMDQGDFVVFLEGDPNGACASAVLLNLRTREKCEVWCE